MFLGFFPPPSLASFETAPRPTSAFLHLFLQSPSTCFQLDPRHATGSSAHSCSGRPGSLLTCSWISFPYLFFFFQKIFQWLLISSGFMLRPDRRREKKKIKVSGLRISLKWVHPGKRKNKQRANIYNAIDCWPGEKKHLYQIDEIECDADVKRAKPAKKHPPDVSFLRPLATERIVVGDPTCCLRTRRLMCRSII